MHEPEHKILFVSTYPPEADGIAGYTQAMVRQMKADGNIDCKVLAVGGKDTHFGNDVVGHFRKDSRFAHLAAAETINDSDPDLVIIQHDFDIYGGLYGEYLLDMLERLIVPFVVICHIVPEDPVPEQRNVLADICYYSNACIVMSTTAAQLLHGKYGIETNKVKVLPPAVPGGPQQSREQIKHAYGYNRMTVVSSCGALAPGKGIEYGIRAVSQIAEVEPDLRYLIWGKTHPMLAKKDGEEYRSSLMALAAELGMGDRVFFYNRTPNTREMLTLMAMSDIYLIPNINVDWLVYYSLAAALATGCVVVSTPFSYAQEVLGEGRGLLARYGDSESLYRCLAAVLEDDNLRKSLEKNAKQYGTCMEMEQACRKHANVFIDVKRANAQEVVS